MTRRPGPLKRPETHDKRPGMGRVDEMWRYRLAQRTLGLRLLHGGPDGISQHELARRAKVSQTSISRMESGEGTSIDVIIAVAQVFGVGLDFMVGFDKVPQAEHEIVDRAYERMMSVASALDFIEMEGNDITIKALLDYRDMLRRWARDMVELAAKLRYPGWPEGDLEVRIPYGYEFVNRMQEAIGQPVE